MPNTIQLTGFRGRREEGFAAAGTIKPGHAIIRDSSDQFKKNDNASGTDTALIVAIEDALQGKTYTEAYASGAVVFGYAPLKGDRLFVRVPAGAAAIVIGDRLQLDNTGCFIKQTGGGIPKAMARAALDNSGGGSEAFITVEVL